MRRSKESRREYMWKVSTDRYLYFWPKGCEVVHLTRPTEEFFLELSKKPKYAIPPYPHADILTKYGISVAAFTTAKSGYYMAKSNGPKESQLMLTVKGSYRKRVGSKILEMKDGMMFWAPPNTEWYTTAEKCDFTTLWFRLKNSPAWNEVSGEGVIYRRAKFFDRIKSLASLYVSELYGPTPSVFVLQNIACLLAATLRLEFDEQKVRKTELKLNPLISKICESEGSGWTLARACSETGETPQKLNAMFELAYGCTLPKFLFKMRMERAAKLAAEKTPIWKIAAETGFADGNVLSRAFKNYYGAPPTAFLSGESEYGAGLGGFATNKYISF